MNKTDHYKNALSVYTVYIPPNKDADKPTIINNSHKANNITKGFVV